MSNKQPVPLDQYLALAGYGGRREAVRLIAAGRVKIAGETVTDAHREVVHGQDYVRVDGKLIKKLWPFVYLLLNKPAKTITATKDTGDRSMVYELLGRYRTVVQSVGRLDYDTEGALLFTNDGDLAHALTSPASKAPKTYLVKIKGHPTPQALEQLRNGLDIGGYTTAPAQVKVAERLKINTWLRITLTEGKYRQVRRMMEAIGHAVLKLQREAIGPITVEGLPLGQFRLLRAGEVRLLKELVKA